MYTYKAMRYHAPVAVEFDSLDEAVTRAIGDWERDEAYPIGITDDSDRPVVDIFITDDGLQLYSC